MTIENNWKCGEGNYIVAGSDCFVALLGNFIDNHGGSEYFNDDKIKNFLANNINRFLYSFGTGLSYKTKKFSKNHSKKISTQVDTIVNRPFMTNTSTYIDSGGFQVAMGAIAPEDMPNFINLYHTFIKDNYNKFKYAFTLDLPPGPSSSDSIFNSYHQIEELNRLSYQTSANLPQEIKDKMIYVHHFRTPSIYDTWSKFMWEENLAKGYKKFATGGIVAGAASDITIPVIIYTIPLSEVLKYAMSQNLTQFNFHVLGGANFIDVFYHKLFSHHIKKVHNVDVTITYDSSAIFKALAIGRFIPVFRDDGILVKMDLKSNGLHLRFDSDGTVQDKVYFLLNQIADNYGFRRLDPKTDPIYDVTRDTFTRSVHMYLILYYLRIYRELELISQQYVDVVYPLFQAGKIDEFDRKCMDLAQRFNQGKNTRKQRAKICSIYRSLQILTNMDREYNKFIIHKFMSSDDIASLDGGGTSVKF